MKQFIIKSMLPFLLLAILFFLLWQALATNNTHEKPSPLIGTAFPAFSLPDLFAPSKRINQEHFKGQLAIINVWASWCYACELEQTMLMKISRQYHIPVYGVDYKDNPDEAKNWLVKHGNPFTRIINDEDGELAIDLGVFGTPETFIITREGNIVYRHTGVINEQNFHDVILPILKRYQV